MKQLLLIKPKSNYSRSRGSTIFLLVLALVIAGFGFKLNDLEISDQLQKAIIESKKQQTISSLWGQVVKYVQKEPVYTQKEIESYIKVIFGKDSKVAIAVSHKECNPKNKAYPKCVALSDKELSVGIFQINLKNKTHLVHASKVPGKTIEEKAEKLKDPHINTLVAYKIFKDSGWYAWSAYTSGAYLTSL